MEKEQSAQFLSLTCEICGELAFEGQETETCWDIKSEKNIRMKRIYHQRCLDAKEETD